MRKPALREHRLASPNSRITYFAMQLREFAERVLFSTNLEEKLAPPPHDLVDDEPGTAIGRPGLTRSPHRSSSG